MVSMMHCEYNRVTGHNEILKIFNKILVNAIITFISWYANAKTAEEYAITYNIKFIFLSYAFIYSMPVILCYDRTC